MDLLNIAEITGYICRYLPIKEMGILMQINWRIYNVIKANIYFKTIKSQNVKNIIDYLTSLSKNDIYMLEFLLRNYQFSSSNLKYAFACACFDGDLDVARCLFKKIKQINTDENSSLS